MHVERAARQYSWTITSSAVSRRSAAAAWMIAMVSSQMYEVSSRRVRVGCTQWRININHGGVCGACTTSMYGNGVQGVYTTNHDYFCYGQLGMATTICLSGGILCVCGPGRLVKSCVPISHQYASMRISATIMLTRRA